MDLEREIMFVEKELVAIRETRKRAEEILYKKLSSKSFTQIAFAAGYCTKIYEQERDKTGYLIALLRAKLEESKNERL